LANICKLLIPSNDMDTALRLVLQD
jgi:hypothetical protein